MHVIVHVLHYPCSYLQENPDLWKWLTGQEQPPDVVNINPVRHVLETNFSVYFSPDQWGPWLLSSYDLIFITGICSCARQGYEQPQQPCFSWDSSNSWAALGKRLGRFQERSRCPYNWEPVVAFGDENFKNIVIFCRVAWIMLGNSCCVVIAYPSMVLCKNNFSMSSLWTVSEHSTDVLTLS